MKLVLLILIIWVALLTHALTKDNWDLRARINALDAAVEVLVVDYGDYDRRIAILEGDPRTSAYDVEAAK